MGGVVALIVMAGVLMNGLAGIDILNPLLFNPARMIAGAVGNVVGGLMAGIMQGAISALMTKPGMIVAGCALAYYMGSTGLVNLGSTVLGSALPALAPIIGVGAGAFAAYQGCSYLYNRFFNNNQPNQPAHAAHAAQYTPVVHQAHEGHRHMPHTSRLVAADDQRRADLAAMQLVQADSKNRANYSQEYLEKLDNLAMEIVRDRSRTTR